MKKILIALLVIVSLFGASQVVEYQADYKDSADPGGGTRPKW